jgi:hypothetical protein
MLAKKLGDIRFLAIFGFCTILYVAGVVVGYSLDPSNNDIDYNLTQITWFQVIPLFDPAKNSSGKEQAQLSPYSCSATPVNRTSWTLTKN